MEENLFSYPAVLNLNGKRCSVIGGGKVALRKVRTLLASGAQVYGYRSCGGCSFNKTGR